MGSLTLLIGGARSGKSTYAESKAARVDGQVLYLATAEPLDPEMTTRIERHRRVRPEDWKTLEVPQGIVRALKASDLNPDLVLLDCVTMLVSNLVLKSSEDPEQPDQDAAEAAVDRELEALIEHMHSARADWLVVTNEVGMGLVPPYPLGRIYRDLLGWANRRLARAADEVYFMTAGMALPLHELGFHIQGDEDAGG